MLELNALAIVSVFYKSCLIQDNICSVRSLVGCLFHCVGRFMGLTQTWSSKTGRYSM